jgi:acid phosphatase family membrane protein YuiD
MIIFFVVTFLDNDFSLSLVNYFVTGAMQVLNMIVEDLFQGHPISQRKLKELLGHTPSQVLAGAVLGIVVACICCQASLVST